jgi:hypothetical protein
MPFFLSFGSIQTLMNPKNFKLNDIISSNAVLRVNQVLNFNDEKTQELTNIQLVLFDGEKEHIFVVDKSLFSKCVAEPHSERIFVDAVIILKSYSIIERDEYKLVIQLNDFQTIGLDRVVETPKLNQNNTAQYQHGSSHFLAELKPSNIVKNHSVDVVIMEISEPKRFCKESDKDGIVQRLLLRDSSGQLEMVIFGELTQRSDIQKLKTMNVYRIKNFSVRTGIYKYRLWGAEFALNYDIHCQETTVFEPLGVIPDQVCSLKRVLDNDDDDKPEINPSKTKRPKASSINFVQLSDLILHKVNSRLDVLAYIVQVDENVRTKDFKKKGKLIDLQVRNAQLLDTSNKQVSLALWGQEAESFSVENIGSIIMLKQVRLSNFNGLSLTKDWDTIMTIVDPEGIKNSYMDEIVELREWRSNNCHRLID